MKKTFTINISGIIFHIDEDAYEKLQNYLAQIYNRFSTSEEGKEIIADIEARIAELFNEKLKDNKEVVSLADVDEVIKTMGNPNDFEDEDEEETGKESTRSKSNYKTGKRLYRDPDSRVLGGVCSGIGLYFGVDPVFIRILILILTFLQVGIVVYIILWIAVPAARTTAQKLEMRGERVTVSNIERSFTEEFNEVKSNFHKFRNSKPFDKTKESLSPVLDTIGMIFRGIGKAVIGILGISFIALGALIVLGFAGTFYSGFWLGFTPFEFNLFSDSGMLTWIADISTIRIFTVALFLIIGIPILAIIYGGFKVIFRFHANHKLFGIFGLSLWVVGLFMALAALFMEGSNFRSSSQMRETHTLSAFNGTTLFLETYSDTLSDYIEFDEVFDIDEVKIVNNYNTYQPYIMPEIRIQKSMENYFELIEKRSSHGSNRQEARELASNILFNWEQKDSLLVVDNYFTLPASDKFRIQELELILKVPVGARIFFDESLTNIAWNSNFDGDYWPGDLVGKEWIMTSDGLTRYRGE